MATTTPKPDSSKLTDVQASEDFRRIAIDKVGVKNVTYPICILTREGEQRHTVASVNMYVSLPHHQKGTHMSRFLEILNDHCREMSLDKIPEILHDIREKLEASEAHIEMHFTYFINKKAPVSGKPGLMDYQVTIEATSNGHTDLVLGVKVPATSLCPCSKEISAYGAHNQRCEIEAKVRLNGRMLWIEDLVEIVENAASSQLYSVLKRPDEKYVTEYAYDHPKFVEDIVRDLAVALDEEDRVVWYYINSENFESIHSHNAYASIEKDKRQS